MTKPARQPASEAQRSPRIMVHVVAYNAASTLAKVLDRIPRFFRPQLSEICVFDDASRDDTYLVGQGYKAVRGMPQLRVFRNESNQGYGGNQKLGYRYAIDNGFDYVVLLHGDGQYAPEAMPNILQPLLDGEADAVFGSRMMDPGAARRGGMPLYKWLGNRVLTKLENAMLESDLSEFHSGYRAYSVAALKRIPFEQNTDDFHFDTQIIVQLLAAKMRIKEVPIPTYYGQEVCHVNGLKYAKDVVRSVIQYRMHQAGVTRRPEYAHVPIPHYAAKESPFSSHRRLVDRVPAGARVLDVGCAGGYLAQALREKGCHVVGVDAQENAQARAACHEYHVANLDGGTWRPDRGDFDRILFGDVLEHLRDTSILDRCADWLAPDGRILASTGNIALWFMRLQLLAGRFRYTPLGLLDETHVRLYTRKTFRELLETAGFQVVDEDFTVVPVEKLVSSIEATRRLTTLLDAWQHQIARRWPEMFAYQIILEGEPRRGPLRLLHDNG